VPKPDKIVYLGKVFQRKDGDMQRRVVSLDKSVKLADGSWENVRPAFLEYEDGERIRFDAGPFTLKYLDEPKGNHEANIYQAQWPKEQTKSEDFKDEDIPF